MGTLPITTERLTLRLMVPADAPVVAEYRGDPDTAKYQDWTMPYSVEAARIMLTEQLAFDDIGLGRGVQVAIELDATLVGDLYVAVTDIGVATIGYTLAPSARGRGIAVEAAAAMVDALFARGDVRRVVATMDPENVASMRVVETLGFRFEGVALQAEHIRGEWVDDLRFALLHDEHETWKSRPGGPPETVELVEITDDNIRPFSALRTFRFQEGLVAPVVTSLAQAGSPPVENGAPLVPWFRGILADGEPAGFIMASEVTPTQDHPYLWRFLVDHRHQGRGIGERVIARWISDLRDRGETKIAVSWVDQPGGPARFYERLGFRATGEMDGDEVVAVLQL